MMKGDLSENYPGSAKLTASLLTLVQVIQWGRKTSLWKIIHFGEPSACKTNLQFTNIPEKL